MEEILFKSNTMNVNVFNKQKNKFEDSTKFTFQTFEHAKKFFNMTIEKLVNEKGFKEVWSFVHSDTYIELENDVYHMQLVIYE